jgi:hypothetical protein
MNIYKPGNVIWFIHGDDILCDFITKDIDEEYYSAVRFFDGLLRHHIESTPKIDEDCVYTNIFIEEDDL